MKLDLIPFKALPPVTSADEGSALVVKKVYSPGAVIVPEQTCVYDEDAEGTVVTNENASLFTLGTKVIATLNGEKFGMGTVDDTRDVPAVDISGGTDALYVEYGEGNMRVVYFTIATDTPITDPFTLSLSVAEETYEYGLDPYPGYDLVLLCPKTAGGAQESKILENVVVAKGSIEACEAKLLAGVPVKGKFVMLWNYSDVDGSSQYDTMKSYELDSFDGAYTQMRFATKDKVCYFTYNSDYDISGFSWG